MTPGKMGDSRYIHQCIGQNYLHFVTFSSSHCRPPVGPSEASLLDTEASSVDDSHFFGIAKKRRRAPVAFSQSNKSAIKFDAPKYESNLQIKKWVQSLQDQGRKKALILRKVDCNEKWESSTEEASYPGEMLLKVQQWSTSVKKRMSQNE
ncbi:unnamed protein product, partial [Sphenostylis stenocarpa]